jgi:hypothetical protein
MPRTTRQVLDEQEKQAATERNSHNRSTTMNGAESYDEWFPSNFLRADDLDDGPMTLTIETQSRACFSRKTSEVSF